MRDWFLLPVLALLWIVESALVRNVTLLSGAADVVFLAVLAWAAQPSSGNSMWVWAAAAAWLMETGSAMPNGVYFVWYLGAVAGIWLLRRRVWQSGLGLYWLVVLLASLAGGAMMYAVLWVLQGDFWGNWREALVWVIIPSTLLNLLWALPTYFFMRELAAWVYVDEEIVA